MVPSVVASSSFEVVVSVRVVVLKRAAGIVEASSEIVVVAELVLLRKEGETFVPWDSCSDSVAVSSSEAAGDAVESVVVVAA